MLIRFRRTSLILVDVCMNDLIASPICVLNTDQAPHARLITLDEQAVGESYTEEDGKDGLI
jgi:hypothetical protein